MPKLARAHHFVPESMIAGFTSGGQKTEKIWVADLVAKKDWATRPSNVAHRRDYYRVDAEGVSPDFVENRLLEPVESAAINVIREMDKERCLPSDPIAMEHLLLFAALLTTRIPLARFMVDDTINRVYRDHIGQLLKSPEEWVTVLSEMRTMGIDVTGMAYSEMQEHFPRMHFTATQHFQIQMMMESALGLLPTLRKRRWSIGESVNGNFICSDRPVVLTYATPPPWSSFPGFALPSTDVLIPLTRHVLLHGTWPTRHRASRQLSHKGVAKVNWLVLDQAQRYVFAQRKDFPWLDRAGTVRYGSADLPRKSDKPVALYK